jgi:hypothetical protein
MDVSEAVRAELDELYERKLAMCRWESHKPILTKQRNMVEDLILRVLEQLSD